MTSEGSEVNEFAQTHLIMQAKFGKIPNRTIFVRKLN